MAYRFALVGADGVRRPLPAPSVQLGRGAFLGVDDKRCSRAQLELRLDAATGTAVLTHHGVNLSRLRAAPGEEAQDLVPGQAVSVGHGAAFSLLGDEHWFTVEARPAPAQAPGPVSSSSSSSGGSSARPQCLYGQACARRTNAAHAAAYSHDQAPDSSAPAPAPKAPKAAGAAPAPAPPPAAAPSEKRERERAAEAGEGAGGSGGRRQHVLAFPSLSTATYMFRLDRACPVAVRAIMDFLAAHPAAPVRLVLATLDADVHAAINAAAAAAGLKDERFGVVQADITQLGDLGVQYIANAANTTFSAGGSGVNKAVHDADPALERATRALHGTRPEVGKAYAVPASRGSVLWARGVRWVLHVLGPNMNPARPQCLGGNYELGCTLLEAAYASLFNTFLGLTTAPPASDDGQQPSSPKRRKEKEASPPPSPAPAPTPAAAHKQGGGWADALTDYIRHPEAHAADIVSRDDEVMVIRDRYPKARHHFLVMPVRLIDGPARLTKADLPLLKKMKQKADEVVDSTVAARGSGTQFRIGFHALPSMRQVHMHVISTDYDSEALKNKKHWNSFTSAFFVDYPAFVAQLQADGRVHFDKAHYEALLAGDLHCPRCGAPQPNLPRAKAHHAACSS